MYMMSVIYLLLCSPFYIFAYFSCSLFHLFCWLFFETYFVRGPFPLYQYLHKFRLKLHSSSIFKCALTFECTALQSTEYRTKRRQSQLDLLMLELFRTTLRFVHFNLWFNFLLRRFNEWTSRV